MIETTASILTKFCTTIKIIKYSCGWSQHAYNKPNWRTAAIFEKSTNHHISQQWLRYSDAYCPSQP